MGWPPTNRVPARSVCAAVTRGIFKEAVSVRRAPRAIPEISWSSIGVSAVATAVTTTWASATASASVSTTVIPRRRARVRTSGSRSKPNARNASAAEPPIKPNPTTAVLATIRTSAAAGAASAPPRRLRPPRTAHCGRSSRAPRRKACRISAWDLGVFQCSSTRTHRASEPGTGISRPHSSGTSSQPARDRTAIAGNSASRSSVTVKIAQESSSGRSPFAATRTERSSRVASVIDAESFRETVVAPRTPRVNMERIISDESVAEWCRP